MLIGHTGKVVSTNGFGRGLIKPLIEPNKLKLPFELHPLMLGRASSASPIDLRATGLVAEVKDQGPVGSCEGHSGSGATETAFALAGDPLGFIPSEDIGYKGARSIERARSHPSGALPVLVDEGAQTEDYQLWISRFGVAPRWRSSVDGRNSDCGLDTCNDNLDLAKVESASVLLAPGSYAIDPQASNAESLVQAALAAKIPVRVDAFVDMVFENWSPGDKPVPTPNDNDPEGGGHAIYIVGWGLSGSVAHYIIRNSWGISWGDGGDVLVSSAWLRAAWGLYPWTVRRSTTKH